MPNWCQNYVELQHPDKSKVEDLVVASGKNKDFGLFQYLYPCPKEELESEGGGYGWRVENWGTKWDVKPDDIEFDGDSVRISFDTAWSPPIALYDMLTQEGWTVNAQYAESGMQFCGQYQDGYDEYFEYGDMSRDEAKENIPSDLYEFADLDYCYDYQEESDE